MINTISKIKFYREDSDDYKVEKIKSKYSSWVYETRVCKAHPINCDVSISRVANLIDSYYEVCVSDGDRVSLLYHGYKEGRLLDNFPYYSYYKCRAKCKQSIFYPNQFNSLEMKDLMNDIFITDEFKKLIKLSSMRFMEMREKVVNNFHKDESYIQQIIDDGQQSIIIFLLLYDLGPSELRKKFGKSLWKRLLKNSKVENEKLMKVVVGDLNKDIPNLMAVTSLDMKKFKKCIDFTGVKNIQDNINNILFTYNNYDNFFHKRNNYLTDVGRDTRHMIDDCMRMAKQLGMEFHLNEKWGVRRFNKYHDDLSLIHSIDYRNRIAKLNDFKLARAINLIIEEKDKLNTIFALDSGMEFSKEGKFMHHCIASYAERSNRDDYLAFKVDSDGERFTLGVKVSKSKGKDKDIGKFSLDQVKMVRNGNVSDKSMGKSKKMVDFLNKHRKDIIKIMKGRDLSKAYNDIKINDGELKKIRENLSRR